MKDRFLAALLNPPSITGQLYVREAGEVNGKRLVMVVGVFATDKFEGECQYTVTGSPEGLRIDESSKVEHGKTFQGYALGSLLTEPIWRV
jgi:hypothetical protein